MSETADESQTPCPRCLRLRTKRDYVSIDADGAATEWDGNNAPTGTPSHGFYCLHTFTLFGPDDELVSPQTCTPTRDCYESPGF